MANHPQELAQDAVCQSHTGHMTGLWFLPTRPLRLNTNEWCSKVIPVAYDLLRSPSTARQRSKTLCLTTWMNDSRPQWPRGLKSRSAAVRLLVLRVLIPPGARTPVSCEPCVCYRVGVSAKGRSLVQMGPTECGVSNWNLKDEDA